MLTGQESPETRRRMLGQRKNDSTLVPEDFPSPRSPLTLGHKSVNESPSSSRVGPSCSSPAGVRQSQRNGPLEKCESVGVRKGKENRVESPAKVPFNGYHPFAAPSPQSSPSRLDLRTPDPDYVKTRSNVGVLLLSCLFLLIYMSSFKQRCRMLVAVLRGRLGSRCGKNGKEKQLGKKMEGNKERKKTGNELGQDT